MAANDSSELMTMQGTTGTTSSVMKTSTKYRVLVGLTLLVTGLIITHSYLQTEVRKVPIRIDGGSVNVQSVNPKANITTAKANRDLGAPGPEAKLDTHIVKLRTTTLNSSISTTESKTSPAEVKHVFQSELFKTNLMWMMNVSKPQYNLQDAMQNQVERISLVQQYCNENKPPVTKRFRGALDYVMSFRNVTWILMPKTGSTNILRMICILVGPKCTSITNYPDEHHYVPSFMKKVSDLSVYSPQKTNWSTRHFFYVFVRNPWQRLVSTYIEKVLFTDSYIIICKYGQNTKFTDLHSELQRKKQTMSFLQFLQFCVIAQYERHGSVGMEPHLRPQSVSGAFCDLSYSFIGKTETYAEDIKVILQQYKVPDVAQLTEESNKFRKPNEKSKLTSTSYLDRWKSVDSQTIDKITNIYNVDIAMFGYSGKPY